MKTNDTLYTQLITPLLPWLEANQNIVMDKVYDYKGGQKKSGVKGVCWCTISKKWRVRVNVRGKIVQLGYYDSIYESKQAIEYFWSRRDA